jgi:hypothetical protein
MKSVKLILNFSIADWLAWQSLLQTSGGSLNRRLGTEKEKDMKRTVSLLTAALFAGALAAPVLAQSPASPESPAAAPSMAPMGEGSPSAEASPTGHHHRHHRKHHHKHHGEEMGTGESAPSGGETSPSAAPSGQ